MVSISIQKTVERVLNSGYSLYSKNKETANYVKKKNKRDRRQQWVPV